MAMFLPFGVQAQNFSAKEKPEDIKKVCDAVAAWQIANQSKVVHAPYAWTNGTLYKGMTTWYKVTGNSACLDFVTEIGESLKWGVGPRVYHADDICVGQSYIDIYNLTGNKKAIQPLMERAYWVASHPSQAILKKNDPIGNNDRWSWCDALFMAPPVYAALYTVTGDKVYLDYLNSEFKECTDSLFDKAENLYYRDCMRIGIKEPNGAKQFWGRGNGWVFAGLPLVIDNLPLSEKSRQYYIELFMKMAQAVVKCQCPGGEWKASLHDPGSYDMPENSCSAFFCYGLAWGIRNGYLSGKQYREALSKGWKSLVSAVHDDGMVGYIQPVGAAPKAAGFEATDVYGVGAYLLAGSELYQLTSKRK